jgi:hypothetical protein
MISFSETKREIESMADCSTNDDLVCLQNSWSALNKQRSGRRRRPRLITWGRCAHPELISKVPVVHLRCASELISSKTKLKGMIIGKTAGSEYFMTYVDSDKMTRLTSWEWLELILNSRIIWAWDVNDWWIRVSVPPANRVVEYSHGRPYLARGWRPK